MESLRNLLFLIVVMALSAVGGYILYTEVLDPDNSEDEETQQAQQDADQAQNDIVELAIANSDLSTLADALTAASLLETLKQEGPYTVLAPNNAAFAEIQESLDTLLLPENQEQLANVLKYHVVSGAITSSDLVDGQEVETLSGAKLTVAIEDEVVYFEDARGSRAMVISKDIEATNGVVHVIDSVLLEE